MKIKNLIKKYWKNHWDEIVLILIILGAILSMLKGMGKI